MSKTSRRNFLQAIGMGTSFIDENQLRYIYGPYRRSASSLTCFTDHSRSLIGLFRASTAYRVMRVLRRPAGLEDRAAKVISERT